MSHQRSQAELLALSSKLLHNAQTFFHVARNLTRTRVGFGSAPPWEIETALVESFALHTRGLADFFYRRRPSRYHHDAFAFQYFQSPEDWQDLVGEPGRWLKRVIFRPDEGSPEANVDRFGMHVAHLTHHVPPVSEYARGWPVMQLSAELGATLRTFVEAVPDRLVTKDFKSKATREIPVLARIDIEYAPTVVWTPPVLRTAPT